VVKEVEEFDSEDDARYKPTEALNSPSSFVFGLQNHLVDKAGLGGKPRLSALHSRRRPTTSTHTALTHQEKLAKFQAVVNPITAKLNRSGALPPGVVGGAGGEDEHVHSEL
jgi:hypothetical protein